MYLLPKHLFQVIYITLFKQGVDLMQSFCRGKLSNSIFSEEGLLGEVQQNPVTTLIFHFPVTALLVFKTNA